MTNERLKQLMEQVGMPNSRSLYDALRQAYMEGYQQLESDLVTLRELKQIWQTRAYEAEKKLKQ